MRFIGDVHGKIGQYLPLLEGCEESIQVGDFGAGFVMLPEIGMQHRCIRGNHDDPEAIKNYPNWIPDITMHRGILCIGGAYSIDRDYRVPGVSWWADEELSQERLDFAIEEAIRLKPSIIVTHDAPETVASYLFNDGNKLGWPCRTRNAFQKLFENYQPTLWVMGHWHKNRSVMIHGTHFICVAELNYVDIDIDSDIYKKED